MHNNYKHLMLTATLLVSGPSFGQANPSPATNSGMSPRVGPTANQAVRPPPQPNPGLKPCESVMVEDRKSVV